MARLVPVADSDDSKDLLVALSAKVKAYVVTWFTPASIKAIYGLYSSARKAFRACSEAKNRNPLAHAACYLVEGAHYYWVDNGGQFHP